MSYFALKVQNNDRQQLVFTTLCVTNRSVNIRL